LGSLLLPIVHAAYARLGPAEQIYKWLLTSFKQKIQRVLAPRWKTRAVEAVRCKIANFLIEASKLSKNMLK
jgi:hypothetical protein